MRRRLTVNALLIATLWAFTAAPQALGDAHAGGVPVLSSRPGAPYTLYLNVSGFNFTGTWGTTLKTPGSAPALDNVASDGVFNETQQAKIEEIWARTAQAYMPFQVNVTTIDPAFAAGRAATDFQRQAFYDSTPGVIHTIIGPQQGNWLGASSGASYVGLAEGPFDVSFYNGGAGPGYHTNWVFVDGTTNNALRLGAVSIHEAGHMLGLTHQSDYVGNTLVNEYSLGDGANTSGSYAPIMGATYYTQRGAWRLGDARTFLANHTQNDPARLLGNIGIGGYVEDGIGHSRLTATILPLDGQDVDFRLARGVITPLSRTSPYPIGAENYTQDWFSFQSDGLTAITLTCNNGTDFLEPGTADPGATLRSTLTIFDAMGSWLATASEDSSTLLETYSGLLPAGTYYAQISSFGGHVQTLSSPDGTVYNTSYYYDMGAYFLTGTGFTMVPEPGAMIVQLAIGWGFLLCTGRRFWRA